MDVVEYPVLGTEPLPVELANTLYSDDGQITDFLATPELVTGWFAEIGRTHELGREPIGLAAAVPVRELRDAVHAVLSAAVDGTAPDAVAVATLNRHALVAPRSLQLDWSAGRPQARWTGAAGGITAQLGRIADCTIELVAGPSAADLRRCSGPGCAMLFVRNHPRRRWCHGSCGHRDRQARYYRRHRAGRASTEADQGRSIR